MEQTSKPAVHENGYKPEEKTPVGMRANYLWILIVAILFLGLMVVLLSQVPRQAPTVVISAQLGGDPQSGKQMLGSFGCGACHTIPGVAGANGKVGPRLDSVADHAYIAGYLPNNINNLAQWIEHPQEVAPGNAMPDMGVSDDQAHNIAAYLYSISAGKCVLQSGGCVNTNAQK